MSPKKTKNGMKKQPNIFKKMLILKDYLNPSIFQLKKKKKKKIPQK